jgi:hypothetical protein
LHEALDQTDALFGPLLVAAVLSSRGDYRMACAALGVPAAINLVKRLSVARPFPSLLIFRFRAMRLRDSGGVVKGLPGALLPIVGTAVARARSTQSRTNGISRV